MQGVLVGVGILYSLLLANFYNQSHGFEKFHDEYYALWKVTPIVFLVLFALLHGGGMSRGVGTRAAVGLLFGGIGDYVIGSSKEHGLVLGAIAFGIGHIAYLSLFAGNPFSLHVPSLVTVLGTGALVGNACLTPLLSTQPLAFSILTLYSLFLSAATLISLSQYFNRTSEQDEESLRYRMLGFCLFFASDNMLILHATGYYVPFNEISILGTYFSAQFLILTSFVTQCTANTAKKMK